MITALIKKYSILVIASIVTTKLLTSFILFLCPNLLTTQTVDGATQTYSSGFLEFGIEYIINIIFVFLLYHDMKKMKFISIPILTLSFFSSIIGIIFFLFINAYENLTTKN